VRANDLGEAARRAVEVAAETVKGPFA
jgi:hypothetical protein